MQSGIIQQTTTNTAAERADICLVQPVVLTEADLNTIKHSDCEICQENLTTEAVEYRCCGVILHWTCVRSLLDYKMHDQDIQDQPLTCPHCRRQFDFCLQEMSEQIDGHTGIVTRWHSTLPQIQKYTALLDRLNIEARLKFLDLIHARKDGAGMLRCNELSGRFWARCLGSDKERRVGQMLLDKVKAAATALETWQAWIEDYSVLKTCSRWCSLADSYGRGYERFRPQIAQRLRTI